MSGAGFFGLGVLEYGNVPAKSKLAAFLGISTPVTLNNLRILMGMSGL